MLPSDSQCRSSCSRPALSRVDGLHSDEPHICPRACICDCVLVIELHRPDGLSRRRPSLGSMHHTNVIGGDSWFASRTRQRHLPFPLGAVLQPAYLETFTPHRRLAAPFPSRSAPPSPANASNAGASGKCKDHRPTPLPSNSKPLRGPERAHAKTKTKALRRPLPRQRKFHCSQNRTHSALEDLRN